MPSPVMGGNSGGGADITLTDPGNVWEANTAVIEGYRIAETVQGELRVFEAVSAGTTGDLSGFTDLTIDLTPLGLTSDDDFDWRYLGIVGQVSWELSPLQSAFGVNNDGPYVAGNQPISQAETTFRILPALDDPGNEWEAATEFDEPGYRIGILVDGASRVFQLTAPGTSGLAEPDWNISTLGSNTTDGTATWAYLGIIGNPDFERPVFTANSAGDADWFLDVNNGSGFRFNVAENGVGALGRAGEFTSNGLKVYTLTESFEIQYDPFSVTILGLPTSDPGVGFAGQLWRSGNDVKISTG